MEGVVEEISRPLNVLLSRKLEHLQRKAAPHQPSVPMPTQKKKKFSVSEDDENYIFLSEHVKSTGIIGSLIFRLVLTTKYKVKLKQFLSKEYNKNSEKTLLLNTNFFFFTPLQSQDVFKLPMI